MSKPIRSLIPYGLASSIARMIVLWCAFTALTLPALAVVGASSILPAQLRCEYRVNPLGIDTVRPRFSWICAARNASDRGLIQTAYRVLVASSPQNLAASKGDLWESGKILSDRSDNVAYAGAALKAGQRCYWKVEIWDGSNRPSAWSAPSDFSIGLPGPRDWHARWIGMDGGDERDCPWFRKEFSIISVPESALIYVGSIGYHELYVNGHKVGDQVLTPSVSDLQKRALYLTYDVRPLLKPGMNVVAIWGAPGWGPFRDFNPVVDFHVAKSPLVIAQLQLGAARGPFQKIVTDATWRCAPSTTRHLGEWHNSDYGGDQVDASREVPNWNRVGLDDSGWAHAHIYPVTLALSPDAVEPNRKCDTILPTKVEKIAPGKFRFVMAKLFTGWVEVRIKGTPGRKITISISSLSDRQVEFNERDAFVLGPSGVGTFCNRFSYHECGFVTVEGLEDAPAISDVTGYRIANDRKRTGDFDCSNRLLKKIYDITVNTYVNLSTGGMTVDCPHRERLGYGGDGHTSLELALGTFESDAFFHKWARDWCDIQEPDGRIYHTAPTMGGGGGPAWSGFVIFMPWEVYQTYGDTRILERTYPTAHKWLAYLDAHVGSDGILAPLPGGDWYFLGDWAAPGRSEASNTPEALLFNNCYYLYVTRLAAHIANVLGKPDDARALTARADTLRQAINKRFLNPDTKAYLDTRETHCVMPLLAGAVPADAIPQVMTNLENEILVTRKGHLDTGLHGTVFLTKYLTEHDRNDLVYTYATQTTAPSYGDLIAKGYATWPEYWEGADSRMHGCLNGIGGWFQRGVAGIRPDPAAPGFKRMLIQPAIVGDVTWAKARFKSPQGTVISAWNRKGGRLTMDVVVPANTRATVVVPVGDARSILESGKSAMRARGVTFRKTRGNATLFDVASGAYHFSAPFRHGQLR